MWREPVQLVSEMLNAVGPAVAPGLARRVFDTEGKVTVKSPLSWPLILQVVSVIEPLNVIVPSTANADCDASAPTARNRAE